MSRTKAKTTNDKHETVKVSINDVSIDIDKKIAPLILACWSIGIQTRYCCQGRTAKEKNGAMDAYIMFESMADAFAFIYFGTLCCREVDSYRFLSDEEYSNPYSIGHRIDLNGGSYLHIEVDGKHKRLMKIRKPTITIRFPKKLLERLTSIMMLEARYMGDGDK